MADWNWNDDYCVAYAETEDPRVIAVIERDDYADHPDGCVIAPTIYGYEWWSYRREGSDVKACGCFDVCLAWEDVDAALKHFGEGVEALGYSDSLIRRWLRIFHGTEARLLASTIDRYTWALVLSTPEWLRHVGGYQPDEGEEQQAYIDGEVYGIGHALRAPGAPFDIEEADVTMECWGFYGEEWAKEAALSDAPKLDPMLW